MNRKTKANADQPTTAQSWSSRRRLIYSLMILFHLLAVVAAPLAGPPPSSQLARGLAAKLDWYIRPLYLGHGYRFFAPNPGPSHLVRFEAVTDDGKVVEGCFPDPNIHWPRLYYHRLFMLSETLNSVTGIEDESTFIEAIEQGRAEIKRLRREGFGAQAERISAEIDEEERRFAQAIANRDSLLEAVARQIAIEHQASEVRLYVQEHLIPTPLDVELGRPLDDPGLIVERPVFAWTGDE